MDAFNDLYTHNHWANRRVLNGLRRAEPAFLQQEARPEAESIAARLEHWFGVERGFLGALEGNPQRPQVPPGVNEMAAYEAETGQRFSALLSGGLDRAKEVYIPWWERKFTVAECLSQVLSHSAQHRAEVAWELARAGIDTGEMDFIVWAAEHRGE
jgi:uncharacterized damage-inducible protein DinB